MSQKNIAHQTNVTAHSRINHSREILIVVGLFLASALIITLFMVQSNRSEIAASSTETIEYSNALANYYAQPWLEAQTIEVASAPQFSKALANEYAAPWLKTNNVVNDPMAMQYAQPWLEAESTAPLQFSNALANHYAAPWLEANAPTYSDALAMQYASPWLNAEKTTDCNGRLDMMYACQYRHQN